MCMYTHNCRGGRFWKVLGVLSAIAIVTSSCSGRTLPEPSVTGIEYCELLLETNRSNSVTFLRYAGVLVHLGWLVSAVVALLPDPPAQAPKSRLVAVWHTIRLSYVRGAIVLTLGSTCTYAGTIYQQRGAEHSAAAGNIVDVISEYEYAISTDDAGQETEALKAKALCLHIEKTLHMTRPRAPKHATTPVKTKTEPSTGAMGPSAAATP